MRRRMVLLLMAAASLLVSCGDSDEDDQGLGGAEATDRGESSDAPPSGSGGFVVVVDGAIQSTDVDLCTTIPGGGFVLNAAGPASDGSRFDLYVELGDPDEISFTSDTVDIELVGTEDDLTVTVFEDGLTASGPTPGGGIQVTGTCSE